MDVLERESYWEGQDQYEEYDEDVSFDESYSSEMSGRTDVYCRHGHGSAKLRSHL